DRRIRVTDDTVRKILRIDLPPTHCFAWCRAAQSTGVRARIGALQKVIVTALFDTHHFLNLRLGLQDEVLWRATAENKDTRGRAIRFRRIDNGRWRVHVAIYVELQLRLAQRHGGHIHPDGTIARRTREDRHGIAIGGTEDARLLDS